MTAPRQILVTSALPYANGSLHLGHILEAIQTDIWVRFQQLRGHRCLYICANDAHGTPIMLKAQAAGISPEQLIANYHQEHLQDYRSFNISFDNFYTTHSEENQLFSEQIYRRCKAAGYISEREIVQAYDEQVNMFLSDRFIVGNCPRCNAPEQYGDNCEVCGASYNLQELKKPRSVLSNSVPVQRSSLHYFFRLPQFADKLQQWLKNPLLQPAVVSKLREWLDGGLQEWDISRDTPYFGFQIPDSDNKFFYVWLDAPIGYMASSKNLFDRSGERFDDWWGRESAAELHHFIGKDIINFHGLFWPALLSATDYRLPTAIYAHGFLTVNGSKMSKSKGTLISASDYRKKLDSDALRYYFAARLDSGVSDIDLNLEDFFHRVNSDLVGKIINIASRCARFICKNFDGYLGEAEASELIASSRQQMLRIAELFEKREYSHAVRMICELADATNSYIDRQAPWVLARTAGDDPRIQVICTTGLVMFRMLILLLKPIIPDIAGRAEEFFGEELTWQNLEFNPKGRKVNPFVPLMQRLQAAEVNSLLVEN